jgi:predicted nucleic acid-binding protein
MTARFLDSNVILYLLSSDARKAGFARSQLRGKPHVSVQILNEVANVARRKAGLDSDELDEFLSHIRNLCEVAPLTVSQHKEGLAIARRHGVSVYDSMVLASAKLAGCELFLSEDMQHGFDLGALKIANPFAG